MNKQPNLLRLGIIGTVIASICCVTPVLVILFSVIGLAGLIGYLDYVLFPALAFFIGLSAYALYNNKNNQ